MSNQAKETIYLSFGTFANHITSHFFNEQESYFDYGLPSSSSSTEQAKFSDLIDHDVSFKEGYSEVTRAPTYLPRALLFDTQLEFGALRRLNRLYDKTYDAGDEEQEDVVTQLGAQLWENGGVQVLHTANSIAKSSFQKKLDAEEMGEEYSDGEEEEQDSDDVLPEAVSESTKVDGESSSKGLVSSVASSVWRSRSSKRGYRFWSDYLRVHYHPRSLITSSCAAFGGTSACRGMMGQTAAEAGEEEDGEGLEDDEGVRLEGFDLGYALGKEMEREKDLMDENVRWFAEDCDLLQSFSVTSNLNDGFAGLSYRYIEELKDEYGKTPVLAWAASWGSNALTSPITDQKGWSRRRLRRYNIRSLNAAVSLALVSDVASLYTPLVPPKLSPQSSEALGRYSGLNMYHSSALLSAYLETATLPMRLRSSSDQAIYESAASLVSRLNWRRDNPIASLAGCMPTPLLAPVASRSKAIDPIEALLAAKGYMPKRDSRPDAHGQRETSADAARKAAGHIKGAWTDLSGGELFVKQNKSKTSFPPIIPFAQSVVARDADSNAQAATMAALLSMHSSEVDRPSFHSSFIPGAYNVPDSFPQLFSGLTAEGRSLQQLGLGSSGGTNSTVRSLPMISSLQTSTDGTYQLLRAAKRVVTEAIDGHLPLSMYGIGQTGSAGAAASEDTEGVIGGRDGLKEIRERLEDLASAYESGFADGDTEGDGRGTDEEWPEDPEEWDMDDD